MPFALQTGDVAVLPSMWEEPFCLVLADAMLRLYENPDERARLSESARKRGKFLSKERYFERFREIIAECL